MKKITNLSSSVLFASCKVNFIIITQVSHQVYVAIYDYTAADDDEITINEGDRLSDVTIIDEGWMEGVNTRTGSYGMFPSNYVQAV